eukprot:CAMPEP_0171688430 /NCGR_PEP_ID=MMETSP0991-20121206/3887_1 /TAXON_ID=483369 /ORGANISM="non described non described, Strain CCMP2098" /LENGTH=399 /DNA_ID=CAMNT_0012276363 /DNA_START=822 /DNA_END=2017 /DNA_ORIENTATION=-
MLQSPEPSPNPVLPPTPAPTRRPTPHPSNAPTQVPKPKPSLRPSASPSSPPTTPPTPRPSTTPTAIQLPGLVLCRGSTCTPADSAMMVLSHNVSEGNGASAKSSHFTVALTSPPLSPVTVSFSSRQGSVELQPSSVVFTFQDFDVPVAVVVSAVDDDVAQAGSGSGEYQDAVLTSVACEDSEAQCRGQQTPQRLNCGALGAVLYDGLHVQGMNVTVTDNDAAGVQISAVGGPSSTMPVLTATYDNFGDALARASYNISLTSRPLRGVSVTLTGLSSYSSIVVVDGGGGSNTATAVPTQVPTSQPTPQPSINYDCDFEVDLCFFVSDSDTYNGNSGWRRQSGDTDTVDSGATIDHTEGTALGHYAYAEHKFNTGTEFYLSLDAGGPFQYEKISFWYHMFG